MRGTLGTLARTSHALGLLVALALALPSAAGATVFTSSGELDTSSFESTGQALAEGTDGVGKYVWVVDHQLDGDALRGFDQALGGAPVATITGDGGDGYGPGRMSSIVGMGFDPVNNNLFVADAGSNRIFVFPRTNSGTFDDPVNLGSAFAIDGFNPITVPIDGIRGLALDPAAGVGYASTLVGTMNRRVLLEFHTTPAGQSISWVRYVYDPGLWSDTVGPGAIAVDPTNGNIYTAINGSNRIQGYTRDIANVVPGANSPSSGDFTALYVDHAANRLIGVKAGVIEVYSLSTGRYLGDAGDGDFGSANAGFTGVGGSFFAADDPGPKVNVLAANAGPTCDVSQSIHAITGLASPIVPDCTDADGSPIKEFSIEAGPANGTAQLVNDDSEISYSSATGYSGPDTITFRVMTRDGRSASYVQPIDVSPDSTPPTVTISSPEDGSSTNQLPIEVDYTVSDDYDPSPSCNVESGVTYNSLAPGPYNFNVDCTDDSGNAGSASVTATYDTAPPNVEIVDPPDNSVTNSSTITLQYSLYDDLDPSPTCDYQDGDSVDLDSGPNTITVQCADAAGNTASASVDVYYDSEPPQVTINTPGDGALLTDPTPTVDYSASDNYSGTPDCSVIYLPDGYPTDSETGAPALAPGANQIFVTCRDTSGNVGSAAISVTYDATPPQIDITAPADGAVITDPTPEVQYTATDAIDDAPQCDTYYLPDGYVFDSESGGAPALEPGHNQILVRCRDASYNFSDAYIDVTYDATAPFVGITAPANGSVVSTATPTLSYTVSDDTDEAPSCTPASGSALNLAIGTNTVTVTCTDAAGRVGSDSATVTYTPPVNSLSQPVVRQTTNLEPTSGDVLIKLPGSDQWIPIEQAVNIPLGTIIDTRNGHAKITLANADGSTYQSEFWGGIFQVFQMTGDNPVALLKLRDDVAPSADANAASVPHAGVNPFRGAEIARRKKKNGLWGSGHGKFRTSGSGGSATVRGTIWYVADYEGGTLFKVARGVVEVRPVHGNCFDLQAGQSKFIEYTPPVKKPGGGPPKKKKKKKGCELS